VTLGETGVAIPSGTYGFTALIGSVLNKGVQVSSPQNTKIVAGAAYGYPESTSVSPTPSPYTASGTELGTTPSASYNGGGVTFSSFTNSTYDNVLQVTNANLPSLLNNYGTYSETENLWLTGFPVYDQQSSVNNFAMLSAGGAYQVVFNNKVPLTTSSGAAVNAQIKLLGSNWTIINGTAPTGSVASTAAVSGGKLLLASSLSNMETVYVGHNLTSGGFTVQLADLGQPNSNGISPASILVYYNNVLTNTTSIFPAASATKFNVTGHVLYVKVNQTFAGLYAYQKWAKMQLYSNVFPLTSGQKYNQTVNQGWTTELLWANQSGANSGRPDSIESILFVNTSPTTLMPGQSFYYMQNPQVYAAKLVGETLGSANYDNVQMALSAQTETYANAGSGSGANANVTAITEPGQLLTVTSSIPNAFTPSVGSQTSTLLYDLTPYQLVSSANSIGVSGLTGISVNLAGGGNFVSNNQQLTVTVYGNKGSNSRNVGLQFSGQGTLTSTQVLDNVTGIELNRAIPGAVVTVSYLVGNSATQMAQLTTAAPELLYQQSGKSYLSANPTLSVTYNQQVGQPTSTFALTGSAAGAKAANVVSPYFTFSAQEYPVPALTSPSDYLEMEIYNSTTGISASPLFQLNYSVAGTKNNATYISSQSASLSVPPLSVPQGFRTERGSKVASITPSTEVWDLAKDVDTLQFTVGTTSATTNSVTTQATIGPFAVGQAVTGFSGLTVANVTGKCSFTTTSCSVTGINSLSVSAANAMSTRVAINTATTPIAELDSQASNTQTVIVVGSKYVNTVAQQIFAANPSLDQTFGPGSVIEQAFGTSQILVAGYSANDTVTAGNQFINDLLTAASKSA
jgi:hypothetical protein